MTIGGRKTEARVTFVEPASLSFHQTGEFDVPAVNWRPGVAERQLKNQWHLRATPPPSRNQRFVTVLQVGSRPLRTLPPVHPLPGGAEIEGWKVQLREERVWIER